MRVASYPGPLVVGCSLCAHGAGDYRNENHSQVKVLSNSSCSIFFVSRQ